MSQNTPSGEVSARTLFVVVAAIFLAHAPSPALALLSATRPAVPSLFSDVWWGRWCQPSRMYKYSFLSLLPRPTQPSGRALMSTLGADKSTRRFASLAAGTSWLVPSGSLFGGVARGAGRSAVGSWMQGWGVGGALGVGEKASRAACVFGERTLTDTRGREDVTCRFEVKSNRRAMFFHPHRGRVCFRLLLSTI